LKKIVNAGYASINKLSTGCSEEELKAFIKGKNQITAIDTILNNSDHHISSIEKELEGLSDLDINIYSKWDDDFPMGYKLLGDKAPLFIYTKGNTELLYEQNSIAIIGSRECSKEGRLIAEITARRFSEKGYNIVSGLAEGIDTVAHVSALSSGGKTTAVLVDVENIFPEKNQALSEEILNNDGLLIAENPPGIIPAGHLFVSRDRLQSGLSLAIFPIETDIKGGTMHTVRFSEEQKRLIYVPDLKKIDGYNLDYDKAKGILELAYTKRAKTYTKDSYNQIITALEKKKDELYNTVIIDNNKIGPNSGDKQFGLEF